MDTRKADDALRNEVDRLLAPFGGRRLSSKEITSQSHKDIKFGWEIDTQLTSNGVPVILRLLYRGEVDAVLPIVVIAAPEFKPLDFPHLESGGKLCVWPERFIVDLSDPRYVEELLFDSVELIRKAISGELDSHFEEEFQSYWVYHCQTAINNICILNLENTTTRAISVRKIGSNRFVYGEYPDQIVEWMDNQSLLPPLKGKQRSRAIQRISQSAIIFFDRPLRPEEYPRKASDLYSLIGQEFESDAGEILELVAQALVNRDFDTPQVLVSFTSGQGRSVVGLLFQRSVFTRHNRRSVADGFRSTIPIERVIQGASQFRVQGGFVKRADPSWVVGRDVNVHRKQIAAHRVAVIGCGSIGSSIARLMVKSGVEQLVLVDGDELKSENISRHELGYSSVDKKKASALKATISKDFPYVSIDSHDRYFLDDDVFRDIVSSVDLVISCTGNWFSDQALLRIQTEEYVPILFVFVEANASVGHVLFNVANSGAYQSLYWSSGPEIGKLRQTVSKWPGETLVRVPACAGEFQPYGAIEIGHVHSLAAKKAIEVLLNADENDTSKYSVWFGSSSDLRSLGGRWNPLWEEAFCTIGKGTKVEEFEYLNGEWVSVEDD